MNIKRVIFAICFLSTIILGLSGAYAYDVFKSLNDYLLIEVKTSIFKETGNLIKDNPGLEEGWHLLYEKPGNPGLSVRLVINKNTICKNKTCEELLSGDKASVSGIILGNNVLVKEIIINLD